VHELLSLPEANFSGALSEGWRFERAKPSYCIRLTRAELEQKLAEAQRDVELPHGSWRH